MERDSVSDDASSSSDCSVKIPAPLTEEELFSRRLFQLVSNYSFKISLSSERKALALFICRALIKHLPRPSSTDEIDQISKYVGFFSIFIGCFENDLSIRNRISEFQHVINVPGNGDGEIENSSLGGAPTSLMNLIGTMSIELMEFMEKVLIPMSPRVEYALSPATRNDIQALIDAHTQSSIIWKKYVDMFDSKVLPHLKTGEGDHLKLQTDLLGLGWMLLILAKCKSLHYSFVYL